jgi:hypothetical protein
MTEDRSELNLDDIKAQAFAPLFPPVVPYGIAIIYNRNVDDNLK